MRVTIVEKVELAGVDRDQDGCVRFSRQGSGHPDDWDLCVDTKGDWLVVNHKKGHTFPCFVNQKECVISSGIEEMGYVNPVWTPTPKGFVRDRWDVTVGVLPTVPITELCS